MSSPDERLCVKESDMVRLPFSSATKTTKLLAMGALLVAIAGAFAACAGSSNDDSGTSDLGEGNSLPYTITKCPGRACK
jgi:hypothetical protein